MNFPVLIFIGTIFIIMGILFLIIITVCKRYYDRLYSSCTESIVGKFDRLHERLGSNDVNDMRSYYPIFKYIVNGQEYYCKGNKCAYNKKDVNTEDTRIYYNPNNPTESYTDKKANDIIIKVFSLLGTIFLIAGACLIILEIIVF